MKIVLDTNVLISAFFFGGLPFNILKSWHEGKFELITPPEILDEYQRVGEILSKEHPTIDFAPVLDYFLQHSSLYHASPLPAPVCEDPDDDKFLACALAGGCSIIVSGDRHLLNCSGYQKIEVLKPREFIDKYLA